MLPPNRCFVKAVSASRSSSGVRARDCGYNQKVVTHTPPTMPFLRFSGLPRSPSSQGKGAGRGPNHISSCTLREMGAGCGDMLGGDAAARAFKLRLCILREPVPSAFAIVAAPQCCLQESCPCGQRTRISSFHVWVLWLVRDFAVHRSTRRFGSFVFTMSAQALTQRCHGCHDSLGLCTAAQSLARLE